MDKSVYLATLDELTAAMESAPDTPLGMYFKVIILITLNMRYEKIAFNRNLSQHPYIIVKNILQEQLMAFKAFTEIAFIEEKKVIECRNAKPADMEQKHQSLFNMLWNEYDAESFQRYVERYKYRLEINHLTDLIKGKRCLDMGCGNGNFCFALVDIGAAFAAGIDFGPESIKYSNMIRERRNNGNRCEFKVNSVYNVEYSDDFFDFIIQNGVFHHLKDEMKAILEAKRVLKHGGYFWYYTDGEGGISYDLWDSSVRILRNVPIPFMMQIMKEMNINKDKICHLMDGLNATYRHTSWNHITSVLESLGFGEFKRLKGGFDTDFDIDVIENDPYGKDKFGEGDLRILARLIKK